MKKKLLFGVILFVTLAVKTSAASLSAFRAAVSSQNFSYIVSSSLNYFTQ